MLPLERCREILGVECPQSEAELETLRESLYGMASVAVEVLREIPWPRNQKPFCDSLKLVPENGRYEVEERAAIHEFEGGLDRSAAERAAMKEYWRCSKGKKYPYNGQNN